MGQTQRFHESILRAHAELEKARLQLIEDGSEFFRVWVAGSARLRPGHPTYQAIREFSRNLGRAGCDGITGGGPGAMEAANAGFKDAALENGGRIRSEGVTINIPGEEPNGHLDREFKSLSFWDRLIILSSRCDAVVCGPGGIGTLLEFALILQFLQMGGEHVPKKGEPPLLVVVDEFPNDESDRNEAYNLLAELTDLGYFKRRCPHAREELADVLNNCEMYELMMLLLAKLGIMKTIDAKDMLLIRRVETFADAEGHVLERFQEWKDRRRNQPASIH